MAECRHNNLAVTIMFILLELATACYSYNLAAHVISINNFKIKIAVLKQRQSVFETRTGCL